MRFSSFSTLVVLMISLQDGSIREFDGNYSLLSPFICQAVGTKEEKRLRKVPSQMNHVGDDQMQVANEEGNEIDRETLQSSTAITRLFLLLPPLLNHCSFSLPRSHTEVVKSITLQGHQGEVFMCLWNPATRQLASGFAPSSSFPTTPLTPALSSISQICRWNLSVVGSLGCLLWCRSS
jgi:hypothetical protein